ncbi:iron-containing alcohol dehydrogenase [Peribacillus sp. NPDC058002]|uniref:iron-containing alcohol dehydrogenase n=1 Tax=Peribacillus sp. NPDC058002 TaxID=3346301 RepID=UPI0036DC8F77
MSNHLFSIFMGTKLVFGKDVAKNVGEELVKLGSKKTMIVTDKGIINAGLLEVILSSITTSELEYVIYNEVPSNPPAATVEKGVNVFKQHNCDSFVAVGGGSAMDACKAISIMSENDGHVIDYDIGGRTFTKQGSPVITIPTTSGTGSEVTQWAVITDKKRNWKASIGSPLMAPTVSLVDPMLTIGLPPAITAATGVDALTHAIEAYTTKAAITGSSPITDALALEAIRLVGNSLRKAYAQGDNYKARENTMLGSTIAGMAFPQIGLGSTHGLAHPLGGYYDVPHGVANAILLPYIMNFNLLTCPERFANIARVLGENIEGLSPMEAAEKSVVAVKKLVKDVNIPTLKSFDVNPEDFTHLAEDAIQDQTAKDNPRRTTLQDAINLYNQAYNEE